jgi:TPR repeat protein
VLRDVQSLFWETQDMLERDPVGTIPRLRSAATDPQDLEAKFRLAVALLDSEPGEAIPLFTALDRANVDGAAYHLGNLWWDSDPQAAEYWYRRAVNRADFASSAAALGLGKLLRNEGSEEAIVWLEKAMDAGLEGAAYPLGALTERRDQERALGLYKKAVEEGDSRAFYPAARILHKSGDRVGARRLYQVGADLGDVKAMVGLRQVLPWSDPIGKLRWMLRSLRHMGEVRQIVRAQNARGKQNRRLPSS